MEKKDVIEVFLFALFALVFIFLPFFFTILTKSVESRNSIKNGNFIMFLSHPLVQMGEDGRQTKNDRVTLKRI